MVSKMTKKYKRRFCCVCHTRQYVNKMFLVVNYYPYNKKFYCKECINLYKSNQPQIFEAKCLLEDTQC